MGGGAARTALLLGDVIDALRRNGGSKRLQQMCDRRIDGRCCA